MSLPPAYGIIFDLDGTLVDSYQLHQKAWQINAQKYDFSFDETLFIKVFGALNRDCLPEMLGDRSTPDLIEEIDQAIEKTFREILAERIPAMPGAAELLQALAQAGFKLAIGSSAPKENVDACVQGLQWGSYFETVVCQDDVQNVKPDPAIFLLASKRMGIPPENCIVIDDSTLGITAAKAAGMYCIGFQSVGHNENEYTQADRVIHALADLSPTNIIPDNPSQSKADLAEQLHSQKPKKYNCAQSVAAAFGHNELIEELAAHGSGRAPLGYCGALHAALLILPKEKHENAIKTFQQNAGNILCRAIRQAGKTPCTQCVRIAAEIVEKEIS